MNTMNEAQPLSSALSSQEGRPASRFAQIPAREIAGPGSDSRLHRGRGGTSVVAGSRRRARSLMIPRCRDAR